MNLGDRYRNTVKCLLTPSSLPQFAHLTHLRKLVDGVSPPNRKKPLFFVMPGVRRGICPETSRKSSGVLKRHLADVQLLLESIISKESATIRVLVREGQPIVIKTITCPSCKGLFKLPATYSGKNLRCPRCRAVVKVATGATTQKKTEAVSSSDDTPTEGLPSITLGQGEYLPNSFPVGPTEGAVASSFRWSHPAVLAIGLVILIAIGAPIAITWYQRSQRESRIQAVVSKLQTEVKSAEAAAMRFDFDSAIASLEAIRPIVRNSGESQLDQKYEVAYNRILELKTDHERKVKAGWSVFEEKLVSPEEKKVLISERREEERKRQKQEERRVQEEREEEQKRAIQKQDEEKQLRRQSLETDPASSFKGFAERFTRILRSDKSSSIKCDTYSVDVRKTDSLITPYFGIMYTTDNNGPEFQLTFAAQDGAWIAKSCLMQYLSSDWSDANYMMPVIAPIASAAN